MKKICVSSLGMGLANLSVSQAVFGIEKDDHQTKKEKRKRKKLIREHGRRKQRLDNIKQGLNK
tara:strand:+ start:1631 stop:1819 length:189 start_codon:yes stop_codon:yes gene_type:complete